MTGPVNAGWSGVLAGWTCHAQSFAVMLASLFFSQSRSFLYLRANANRPLNVFDEAMSKDQSESRQRFRTRGSAYDYLSQF
jgi:hypothetical protein